MSRRLVVAFGALGLVIVCVAIAVLVRSAPQGGGPTPTPQPSTSPSTSNLPLQTSMLTAVRDDAGLIAGAALMGSQENPVRGSWLSLQPGLSLDLNLQGEVTLAIEGPWDPTDSSASLGNQLDIKVTGGFIMDRLAFAAMVDVVDGVTVDSPVPIIAISKTGQPVVVVKAGKRKIYGPAAAAYVTTLNTGEVPSARMARFDEVWRQVVFKLPGNSDRVRTIISSLGSSARSSMSPDAIATVLLAYQTAVADRTVQSGILPTTLSGAGVKAVHTMTPTAGIPMAHALFADSVLVPGKNGALPRVRFYSAGIPDAAVVQAKNALFRENLSFVWGGQVQLAPTSSVFVPLSPEQVELAEQITKSLELVGVPTGVNPDLTIGVQGAVIGGSNLFAPVPSISPTVSTAVIP